MWPEGVYQTVLKKNGWVLLLLIILVIFLHNGDWKDSLVKRM